MAYALSPTASVPVGFHGPVNERTRRTNRAYTIRPYRRRGRMPKTTKEQSMTLATIPGYPRIGKKRELKRALESYWAGKIGHPELEQVASAIRQTNWDVQRAAGINLLPVNDFSYYDHILDTAALVGAVPERYGRTGESIDLDTYFAMA